MVGEPPGDLLRRPGSQVREAGGGRRRILLPASVV